MPAINFICRMKILLVDNYDSFTYNLVHLVERILGCKPDVRYNDAVDAHEASSYDRIIISPGPGVPSEAGNVLSIIQSLWQTKPILGICLGHQAIAHGMGFSLYNLDHPNHGVSKSVINHYHSNSLQIPSPLFAGMDEEFNVGLYHSWAVNKASISADFFVSATTSNDCVMAMEHRHLNLKGVQFHPESILTPQGEQIVRNWFLPQ